MTILHRYLGRDFLVTFGMTVLIFTFVMCAAAIIKAIDLMARGISGEVILKVFIFNMPYILTFSIPMSVMTATLLLFSRLSFDGEITAMKACGISLWQIIVPVVLIAIVMSGVCLYLNNSVAPNSRHARGEALRSVGAEDPINLLDEGRFITEFPRLQIYVGRKRKNKVKDVVVYETRGGEVKQHVRATHGEIRPIEGRNALRVELYNVRINRPDPADPFNPSLTRTLHAERYPVTLDLSEFAEEARTRKRTKNMTFAELLAAIRDPAGTHPRLDEGQLAVHRMKKLVDANKRIALSVSCLAFALLAIPLGMKSRRKESSAGIGISLAVVFVFYGFIVLADTLSDQPELRPDLLIWVPVIAAQATGLFLIRKVN